MECNGHTDAIPTVAVEAKFKKLLREALEKGILASKVGMLKLIPKAGTAGVEAVGELRVRWSFQVELEKIHLEPGVLGIYIT